MEFVWTPASGNPATYVIEAGSAPGLANLANSDLGSARTSFATSGLTPGTYYVRLRGRNSCGTGPASNEITFTVSAPTPGELIQNPSFEAACVDPAARPGVQLLPGSTSIAGWTVIAADIDYFGTFWQASDGARSLDLDGAIGSAGGIAQGFPTTLGTEYVVSFDLAGNPVGGPAIKRLRVSADGFSQDFSFDTTGRSVSNMGWSRRTWSFVAEGRFATLEFVSLNTERGWGPALDNVRVTAR